MTLPPRLLVPLATPLLAALVWCGNASPDAYLVLEDSGS